MKLLTIASLVCFVREWTNWGELEKEVLVEATLEGSHEDTRIIKLLPEAVRGLISELGIPDPADLKLARKDCEYWKDAYEKLRESKDEQYKALLRAVEGKEPDLSIEIFLASDQKIQAIKRVREVTKIGLKEAKDIIDNWGTQVNWGVSDMRAYSTQASGSPEWPKNTTGKEVFAHLLAGQTESKEEVPQVEKDFKDDPFKDE
jgi:ribosomal protein L7/L12